MLYCPLNLIFIVCLPFKHYAFTSNPVTPSPVLVDIADIIDFVTFSTPFPVAEMLISFAPVFAICSSACAFSARFFAAFSSAVFFSALLSAAFSSAVFFSFAFLSAFSLAILPSESLVPDTVAVILPLQHLHNPLYSYRNYL